MGDLLGEPRVADAVLTERIEAAHHALRLKPEMLQEAHGRRTVGDRDGLHASEVIVLRPLAQDAAHRLVDREPMATQPLRSDEEPRLARPRPVEDDPGARQRRVVGRDEPQRGPGQEALRVRDQHGARHRRVLDAIGAELHIASSLTSRTQMIASSVIGSGCVCLIVMRPSRSQPAFVVGLSPLNSGTGWVSRSPARRKGMRSPAIVAPTVLRNRPITRTMRFFADWGVPPAASAARRVSRWDSYGSPISTWDAGGAITSRNGAAVGTTCGGWTAPSPTRATVLPARCSSPENVSAGSPS